MDCFIYNLNEVKQRLKNIFYKCTNSKLDSMTPPCIIIYTENVLFSVTKAGNENVFFLCVKNVLKFSSVWINSSSVAVSCSV